MELSRRNFLKRGLVSGLVGGASALPFFPESALARDLSFDLTRGVRSVDLYRPATGERLSFNYLNNGVWADEGYTKLCWLLRDVQAGQYVRMDATLIAILDWTQRFLKSYGYTEPLHILSGYRSPKTNFRTEGAVKNSQHLYGKAVDVRIPGLSSSYLGKLFAWLSQGGVGIYESADFIHVDTGRVRYWRK